jgi:hypothetical protein
MNEEQINQHMEKLFELFPDAPDPTHEPMRFKHYMKMYWYYFVKNSQTNG